MIKKIRELSRSNVHVLFEALGEFSLYMENLSCQAKEYFSDAEAPADTGQGSVSGNSDFLSVHDLPTPGCRQTFKK